MHIRQLGCMVALVAIHVAMIGCGSSGADQPSTSQGKLESGNTPAPTLKVGTAEFKKASNEHIDRANALMIRAHELVVKTKDLEAQQVLAYAAAHSSPAIPSENRGVIHQTLPDDKSFWVMVLTEDDTKYGPYWQQIWGQRNMVVARYDISEKIVIVLDDPGASTFSLSLQLIHELRHGKYHATTVIPDTVTGVVNDEFDTYEMQDRMAAKLGGKAYQSLLTQEINNLLSQLTNMSTTAAHEKLLSGAVRFEIGREQMRAAYSGYIKSPVDETFAYSMFNRRAIFAAIDRVFPSSEALSLKKALLEDLIRMAGLFPETAKP